jgi:hypothetical protein
MFIMLHALKFVNGAVSAQVAIPNE